MTWPLTGPKKIQFQYFHYHAQGSDSNGASLLLGTGHCLGANFTGAPHHWQVTTRDIALWEDRRLLSEVMEQGAYEQKPIQGTNKKHFLLHLCWMPETSSQPSPSKKRTGKKKTKQESPPAAPRTALTSKRSRAASGEHPPNPKRAGATTRRLAQARAEVGEDLEDDLPTLEDLLADGETH